MTAFAQAPLKALRTLIQTPRFRKRMRQALIAFGIYVVLLACITPFAVRYFAQKILSEKLERPVDIGSLWINPLNLSATVKNFRIGAEPNPDLRFETLYVNLESSSLFRAAPVLSEITLTHPFVRLTHQGDGIYNWTEIVTRLAGPPEPPKPEQTPARFSLHNIRIQGGEIRFEDHPLEQVHTITALEVGLPLISNIPSQVETFVPLALGMKVDGTPLALDGKSRPFDTSQHTSLSINLGQLELKRYLAYLPFKPQFKLENGALSGEIRLTYEAAQPKIPQTLKLDGHIALDELNLKTLDNQPAVALAHGEVVLETFDLAKNTLHLSRIELQQPNVNVHRDAQGHVNLAALAATPSHAPEKPDPKSPSNPTSAPAFHFQIDESRVVDGKLHYTDEPNGTRFETQLKNIQIRLGHLSNQGSDPASLTLEAESDQGETLKNTGEFHLTPFAIQGHLTVSGASVPRYRPFYHLALPGGNIEQGLLDGTVDYHIQLSPQHDGPRITLQAPSLALRQFALRDLQDKTPFVQIENLALHDLSLDVAEQQLSINRIESQKAHFDLSTTPKGELTALRILGTESAPAASTSSNQTPRSKPWGWKIGTLDLAQWTTKLEEKSSGKPVNLALEDWTTHIENLSGEPNSRLKFSTQARFNRTGRILAEGEMALSPVLTTRLKLNTTDLDLSTFRPYMDQAVKMSILKGKLNTQTQVDFAMEKAGVKGHIQGDIGISGFASRDTLNDTDFVQWRQLQLSKLDFTLAPLSIALDEVKLTGLVTRLILNEQGKLNLREIPNTETDPIKTASKPAKAAPPPAIKIRKINLEDGNIAYSDRFIKPNFDVNIRQLAGALDGLESNPEKLAQLALGGKVDGAAPLKIEGEFNPFRDDLRLDIRASVKDYELSGVSPYTGKYVGYGISKGKLSADLNYKIDNRKLSATNHVKLNQLTLGDVVESPEALKLPLQLAISLLSDRNGVIDLNLPVTGSLDDPQFSVGGVVVQALVNIISKAVTAPFALIGNVFGSDGEEGTPEIAFAPGTDTLGPADQAKLAKLAQALKERPNLKLEITGVSHTTQDRDGLRKRWLDEKMRQFFVQEQQTQGMSTEEAEKLPLPEAEHEQLLKRVYRDADFKKPRSLIGLAKDLPPDEMEKLILENAPIQEESLRRLARDRAQNVQAALDSAGASSEQLFLTETKIEPASSTEVGRVKFSLKQ